MDQQGAEDTPAPVAIYDATVNETQLAIEPPTANPSVPTPNPWLQYQSDPVFWNHFSLFLPFFQQAGYQFPTPAAASPGTAPIVWPGVPLQPQNSALQNPLHPMPALQNIGMFQGMPLFTPIEGGQQQPLATAITNGTIPSSSTSPTLLTPTKLDATQRTARKKRARILREGQLTMIVYGANEALTWARRVAQFQSVMRNVLGDRRKTFTWSGSVTDSVVGAFLTQNVSDALSSRAYMEVASRWPARHNAAPSSSENIALTLGDEADTVDWESIRTASITDLADAIRCRGMQMVLSNNIQSFLNHLRRYNLLKKGARVAANGGFRGIQTDILATMDAMLDRIVENAEEEERNELDSVMAEVIDGVEAEYGLNNHRSSPAFRSRSHVSLEYEKDPSTSSGNLAAAAPPQSALSFEHDLSTPSEQQQQQQEREKALEAARLLSSEWLRDAPDDEARDYLMSINGLGRKSVACIMLLTLGKKEFPVDTNVGRICSRLGWIPLDAAESIEELDDYAPEPEVHAYLRSRLLGFDVETLYELHYQMITLGKVFCSKQNPNCTACPMQKECEYALQNGPSLHGRKRIKVKGTAAFGDGTTTMADTTMNLTSNGNIGNANRGVHWRTQQKIDRLAQEKAARELALADHARLYSTLDLEDLVLKRTTWPRSKGLRLPHGMNLEDAAVSQLQRAEEELKFKFKVTQWEENHPKFLNWFNLDTLELGRQGLLPASVWDTAVAMDVIQDTQKEISEEMLLSADGGGGEIGDGDGSSLTLKERISAWEEALRDAPNTLQYPNKAVTSSTIESGGDCLSIWELAGKPSPPRLFISQQQQQEQQRQPLIGMEPPRPPVLLKSKPVAVDQADTGGDKEILAAEANGGAAAVIDLTAPTATAAVDAMDLDESPVDFVPPEGTTEVDLMDASIAQLLPELMSWMPPPPSLPPALPLAGPVSVPLAAATAAAATPATTTLEEEDIQKVNNPTPLPGTTASLLSSASNIEIECCRLQQLAIELAAENEIILKLEQGADVSIHRKRLLELSLQSLNFDLSISVDSAESVVTAARINYRQLARALHPDKCKLAGAADAFSGLSMAMRIVSEYSLEKEQEEKDSSRERNSEQQQGDDPFQEPFQNLAARAPGGAEESRKKTLEHRIVWNQSRLVVAAHILPSHIHSTFSHLQGATLGAAANDEDEQQVMFLPMSNIPTFQREELAGRRTRTTATGAHDGGGGDVEVVMDGLLNAVCGDREEENSRNAVEKNEEDTLVEGMLLVTCRAALRGRFPLNGTYFQINELFADHQTAVEAVEVCRGGLFFLTLKLLL
jgi:endonuclease III